MNKINLIFKIVIGIFIVLSFYQCDKNTKNPVQKQRSETVKEEVKKEAASSPKQQSSLTKMEQNIKAAKNAFQADLEKFILIPCSASDKIPLDKITIDLHKKYKNSYAKTNLEDGKSFCLHEFYNNEEAISRIIYTRTEGGHYSDDISLWSLNKKTNELKQLQLFSVFGKDGYDKTLTTEIKENTFTITELENSRTTGNLKTVMKWTLINNGDISVLSQ